MKIIFVYIAIIMTLDSTKLYSKSDSSGKWSLLLNGNYNGNFGISEAMNGSEDDFINDLSKDYNNRTFPFGEIATLTLNAGFQISYNLNNSPIGINISTNFYGFLLNRDNSFFSDYCILRIFSISPGIEYHIGDNDQLWNIFGRFGMNINIIWGNVKYSFVTTTVNSTTRLGLEGEFGGRLNIPSIPVTLELSALCGNMNLFGKKYTPVDKIPPQILMNRDLNDGKNPDNPKDINRSITFIALKCGIRIWI